VTCCAGSAFARDPGVVELASEQSGAHTRKLFRRALSGALPGASTGKDHRFFSCGRSPVGALGRGGAAIFKGRERPSLLVVAHRLASGTEGDFLVERNSFRFSVSLVPVE